MTAFTHTKLLVVESSATIRGELAARLALAGFNVVVSDHGAAAGALIGVFDPDIAVIEMLDDGLEELTNTLSLLHRARVIVSMNGSAPPERRIGAIRSGADDIVIKPLDVDELLVRIERVMRNCDAGTALVFEDVRVDEIGHLVYRGEDEFELTVTEFRLLTMFMRNAGRVLSKRQLLAAVWGFDDYDVNLVEVHVSALRRKLEAHGPRIIQTVRGIGYVLRAESVRRRCVEPTLHAAS